MQKSISVIVSLVFLISIGLNIMFISGSGIMFHSTYHQEQYQNQSQAQIILHLQAMQGKLVWRFISNKELGNMGFGDSVEEQYCGYLDYISIQESVLCKITENGIFVPYMLEENKFEEKK